MTKKLFRTAIVVIFILQACGDEHQFFPQLQEAGEGAAKIKFIHAASDTVGVNLFLDDVKLTGNAPSTITTAGSVNLGKVNLGTVTFGNAFPVTDYGYVNSSGGSLKVVFPESYTATLTYPTKTMATTSSTLAAGSFNTVAFVGISPAYEAVVFQDNITATPINGKAFIRFANFIHNSVDKITIKGTPPSTTDDPTPAEVTFFTGVAYKAMTDFIELPRTGTYANIRIYNANTNALIASMAAAGLGYADNKVYTIFARGQIGQTGTKLPTLSRTINR
jgi:hypothetical protein